MNFKICDKTNILRSYYIYIDNNSSLADKHFKNNNIRVFHKKEWDIPNTDYKVIYASVSNQKDYLFVKAMCELEEEILDNGFNEYEEICNKMLHNYKKKKKVKHV